MLLFDSVPDCGFLFFFEDEVAGGSAGGEFDPVGDVGWDANDIAWVEDYFFSALNAGAASFSGGSDVPFLHCASGNQGRGSFGDDHLVGPLLVEFGIAGVDADDEESFAGADIVEGVEGVAGGTSFGDGEEFGFALGQFRGEVDDGSGLGQGGESSGESEGQDEAQFHAASFFGIAGWRELYDVRELRMRIGWEAAGNP
jgi:hypothetical protein